MKAADSVNGDPSPRRRSRKRRIAAWLTLILLILAAPYLVFYYQWMHPKQAIPKVEAVAIDQFVATEASATLALGARLHAARAEAGVPSMSAAIAYDGIVQWAGAVGFADIERRTAATVRSRYRIGSASKALTGTLLVRMVDAGQVDMDAPMSRYVPGLPPHLAPLTARQLASHTAGVRHYGMPAWWLGWWEMYSTQRFGSVEEGLSLFRDDPLAFTPGEDFKYSTFGYALLSRLLEGASGQTFAVLLEDGLFRPAGMLDSAVDTADAMPSRVSFYSADSGRFTPAYPADTSYKIAGGGIVSTPADLVRLGTRLLGDDLVSAAGRTLMWTPVPLADGSANPENYAIGWRIDTSERLLGTGEGTPIIHHGGVQAGGSAFFMLVPGHDIAVAVATNSGTRAARSAVQDTAYDLVRGVVAARATP